MSDTTLPSFLFLDVNTQKDLVEHFGARAIPDCPEIRENLMDVMSFAMRNQYPIFSPVRVQTSGEYCLAGTAGVDKVLDTECESFVTADSVIQDWDKLGVQQVLFKHEQQNPFSNMYLLDSIKNVQPDNVVVFGVALEEAIADAVQQLSAAGVKVWLLKDTVKGYAKEAEILADLRKLPGVSLMTARNTMKFLSELSY